MKKLFVICCIIITTSSLAQEPNVEEPTRRWFVPDHIKLQFAGNIGFLSGGPGYISKNKKLETDVLFGFMPKKFGGDALISLTAKTTYFPWRIPLKNAVYISPFSLGFYSSYTFGPQFDSKWPDYYPKGYYWWATSIRPGAYIGGKLGREVKEKGKIRGLEIYYELGTYDLLLISYMQNNKYLRPSDIVSLSLGIKMAF